MDSKAMLTDVDVTLRALRCDARWIKSEPASRSPKSSGRSARLATGGCY